MPESSQHVFALQIEESDHFINIFGPAVTTVAWDDIVAGYRQIAHKILHRSRILSDVVTTRWGRCFLPFELTQSSMSSDTGEQIAVTRDEFINLIDHKNLETYVQPIVSLPEEKIIGYEALSRAVFGGLLQGADVLFDTAAHFGLTTKLELACIKSALGWIEKIPPTLWVSINIGPDLLKNSAFTDLIYQEQYEPFFPRLILELTEHLPLESVEKLQKSIRRLNHKGIGLSLDDTGCGFFDFHTVKRFRPKIVKLCITVVSHVGRTDAVLTPFFHLEN